MLISDSESPQKMLSNDIYIILFGWITFFGLTRTVLCNTNIRFSISSKNAFKWYIYHLIWLNYLFWPHIYHIRQFWYQNLNLLENCFLAPCRPSSNPEWQSTLPHLAGTNYMKKAPKFWTIYSTQAPQGTQLTNMETQNIWISIEWTLTHRAVQYLARG